MRIMEHNGFDHRDIQLIFPVHNFFLLGSPLSMFVTCYFEENYIRSNLPTCENFYNVFHPSDLIANRIEPLIKEHTYGMRDERNIDRIEDSEAAILDQGGYDSSSGEDQERIDESYVSDDEPEVLPPVLIPCYWNKGLNKA